VGFELTTLVVTGTNCTGSCKSNNHTITTTTDLILNWIVNLHKNTYRERYIEKTTVWINERIGQNRD
jgi:hypothetical protein